MSGGFYVGYFLRVFTLSAMIFSMATVASADNSFQQGDQGTEIAEIQGQLIDLGYDVIADGEYGPATVDAIRQFQESQGINPDGLIGPATYEALLGRDMPDVSRGSSVIARRVVQTSMQYMGVPYVFGGTSPSGFDCSGYVRYVFAQAGISLPRMADEQYYSTTPISTAELRAGDLVFFSTYTYGPSHVGIYLGDGQFIHASSSYGVSIASLSGSYWTATYIGARRVL